MAEPVVIKAKILARKGLEAQLPTLDVGESGVTTDTHKVFMGTTKGNTELVNRQALEALLSQFAEGVGGNKRITAEEVWSYRMPGTEPVFSTPIHATFSGGRKVVIYQSWDWFIYVHDAATGELIWRRNFEYENYGRPQAADVNGDGRIEIFGASHDGGIYCLDEDGNFLWTQYNLYLLPEEVEGTATGGTIWSLVDNSKQWLDNFFIKIKKDDNQLAERNAYIEITEGTGAGQQRKISSVEYGNTIWIATQWDTVPDATSKYKITPMYESDKYFQHAGQLNQENGQWYLYVTGFDNLCRKLDAVTGEIIWRFASLEHNEPYPIILDIDGDGELECLFGSVDEHAYCLNANTGELKWKTKFPEGSGVDCFPQAYDMDNDGEIELLLNSRGGRTYYLAGSDGAIKYQSTDYSTWSTAEINSRPTVFEYSDGTTAAVSGGLAGYVYCYDGEANTRWRKHLGPNIRGSSVIADLDGDGELEIMIPDMMGTLTIFSLEGEEIGQLNTKGGIEGTPLVGDLDGDGNIEVLLTSLDGYVKYYRFNSQ